ncbi:group-specific protein [Paenibacillus nuruki]|uniref:group-specific protein n=1 Tax=Paenibacillus nuruki TaxID=1886670 RepID=UPI0028040DB2|nr:group-specific protein [Paenibacillus nuruki]
MLNVQIDEHAIKTLCRETIENLVKEVDAEYVYWDTAELKKRTCMSWNTIQENFFFDNRFLKRKVGGKWYFPAKETREFLTKWLQEQPRS